MSQRLRIGVDPYAVGFILNKEQMAEIATRAVPSSYLDQHGRDPVLVLKWHVDEHHFEILDTIDARRFFFAIHFYPWHVGPRPPSEVADIPPARRALWEANYGQYSPGRCTEVSCAYLKFLGCTSQSPSVHWCPDSLRDQAPTFCRATSKVVMDHKLGDLLEPDGSPVS
ncbi:hypothetical protein B0H11DRAFT_1948050 [Mycena galericulata]|nr:hypothetical protein B0H11DRAFT_1948050 [Mycena galericulata]